MDSGYVGAVPHLPGNPFFSLHDCWIHSTNLVRPHRGKRKRRLGLEIIAAVYLFTSVAQPVHSLHERYEVLNITAGLLATLYKLVRTRCPILATTSSPKNRFSFATGRSRLKKMHKSMTMTRAVTIATLTQRLMCLMTGIRTRMMRRMKQPLGLLGVTCGSWWQFFFFAFPVWQNNGS